MTTQFAYDGDHVRVRVNDHGGDVVVVTFTYRQKSEPEFGFAEEALSRLGVSNVAVISRGPHWWQTDDMGPAMEAVRASEPFKRAGRVVTYGSSMGGYGALRWSAHLQANEVVAVSPQYSLDPSKTPFEKRWRDALAAIDHFGRDDMSGGLSRDARVAVLYDPRLSAEAAHVELLGRLRSIDEIRAPFLGHGILLSLKEAGNLGRLLRIVAGGYSASAMRQLIRDSRANSLVYTRGLANAALNGRRPRPVLGRQLVNKGLALMSAGATSGPILDARMYNLAAQNEMQQGATDVAARLYQQAADVSPKTADAYRGFRDFHTHLGDPDKALLWAARTVQAPNTGWRDEAAIDNLLALSVGQRSVSSGAPTKPGARDGPRPAVRFFSPHSVSSRARGAHHDPIHFNGVLKAYGAPERVTLTFEADEGVTHYVLRARTMYDLWVAPWRDPSASKLVLEHIAPEHLEHIRAGRWRLVIDLGWESFMPTVDAMRGFHEGLAVQKIPAGHVSIISSNLKGGDRYQAIADDLGITERIGVYGLPQGALLFFAHHRMEEEEFFELMNETKSARSNVKDRKTFLNTNGRMRMYRVYLVAALMARGIADKGLISLLGYQKARGGSRVHDYIGEQQHYVQSFTKGFKKFGKSKAIVDMIEPLLDKMPLELDIEASHQVESARYKTTTPWELQDSSLYYRTMFSVSTDTPFDSDGDLFITEKVCKPLISFHPFIYLGHPGALSTLSQWGFKTFHPAISEIYDGPLPTPERMEVILDEVERLCRLSDDQLSRWYQALWPTVVHNARVGRVEMKYRGAEMLAEVLDVI